MTVLVVYGARRGPARGPAVRLTRSLRRLGTRARVRPADRLVRLGGPSALVLAYDQDGRDEIGELLESFALPADGPPVFGLRVEPVPLPPGVRPLPGTRDGGELPRDPGALLRLASGLTVAVRRLPKQAGPQAPLR